MELSNNLPSGCSVIIGGCTSDNKTYRIQNDQTSEVKDLICNHEEADTRLFAHASWSKKPILQFVASDTDIFAIMLLNWEKFLSKTILWDHTESLRSLHVNALVDAINTDKDQDLSIVKQRGEVPLTFLFGMIHPLLGSAIFCSPRGFGSNLVLKACIDFAPFLFHGEHSLHLTKDGRGPSNEAYAHFLLALFKKRYANKIKLKTEEIFSGTANLEETLNSVRRDTWIYTLENNSILPSKECLELRSLNLSFQMRIWTQATNPEIDVPNPLDYGWEIADDGSYQLIPDSPENMRKQANIFKAIMKKCKCKLSKCKDLRCVCRKEGNFCSSFCECLNCVNTKEMLNSSQKDGFGDDTSDDDSDTSQEDSENSDQEAQLEMRVDI